MSGVSDPKTIDVVAQDAAGEFMVVMVETRPWGTDPDQGTQLREKINTYAGWILHGELVRQYPESAGQPVRVQLDCVEPPNDEIAQITEHATQQLDGFHIGFRVNVLPPQ